METLRVDICYRPLRIAWAIPAGDMNAFRTAAQLSFALWGGRFNPIIVADDKQLSKNLVNLFRADLIIPIGDSDAIKSLLHHFEYLIIPLIPPEIFVGAGPHRRSQVLDIH